jgi:hypothetical protein
VALLAATTGLAVHHSVDQAPPVTRATAHTEAAIIPSVSTTETPVAVHNQEELEAFTRYVLRAVVLKRERGFTDEQVAEAADYARKLEEARTAVAASAGAVAYVAEQFAVAA